MTLQRQSLNDTISLEYILNSYNVDGEAYRCDISRFVGVNISKEKQKELKEKLTQIRDLLHDKRH